jgi:hypothetical protein
VTSIHWALSPDSQTRIEWDPVNLVFWGNASSRLVATRLRNDFGMLWNDTGRLSGKLFAFMNGQPGVPQAADVAFGSLDRRYHLRLYDVPYSPTDPLGTWCIGAVHRERLTVDGERLKAAWLEFRRSPSAQKLRALMTHGCPLTHQVTTWKEPQLVVEALFESHARTRSVDRRQVSNAIAYQQTAAQPGVPFDGLATFIELRR